MPETMNHQKANWKLWRFDQIALTSTDRAQPTPEDSALYIGLEHLDSDSLRVRRWGSKTDMVGTKFRMQRGDILFARRNAYLKRVAIAPHDGLFSAHGMILRPKPDVILPEFLPFFMQSDVFMERAIQISVGSLSPTINWKILSAQEFRLPEKSEQVRAVELFTAFQAQLDALEEVQLAQKNVYQAAIDAFYDFSSGYPKAKLADVTSRITDGVHKKPDYVESGVPFLVVENLTRGTGIDFSSTRYISAQDHAEYAKRTRPERGDVLVSKDGTLGIARLVETNVDFSIFVSLALLKPLRHVLDGRFLRYFFDSSHFRRRIGQKTSGSAILHIHLGDFRQTEIPFPDFAQQIKIALEIRQVEEAIEATQVRIEQTKAMAKAFRDCYFGG